MFCTASIVQQSVLQHQQTWSRLALVKLAQPTAHVQGWNSAVRNPQGSTTRVKVRSTHKHLCVIEPAGAALTEAQEVALPRGDHSCLTCPACLQVLCLQWRRDCPAAPALLSEPLPTRLQVLRPDGQAMD